jgi:protease-4
MNMRLVRGLWTLLVGVKDALVLLLMLLFFGLLYAALSARPSPAIPSGGALLLDLRGTIVEQPAEVDPRELLLSQGNAPATREYRLRDLVRALDLAATDARVKAVALDLDRFLGAGQVALTDMGAAMDRVRRAGKPVLVYATGYTDDGYMLAAHASEVWLNPFGAVLIAGPGGSQLYYKGLLDKIGVTPKVYRVGQFKSAVEPFTLTGQSPAARAANQALADALWEAWQANVTAARPGARIVDYAMNPAAAALATRGDLPRAAKAAGLIDALGDRIDFGRRVAQIAGEGSGKERKPGNFRAIPLDNWLAANAPATAGDPIGVLTVAGTIIDGHAGPGTAAGDTIAERMLDAVRDGSIKALVVRIDSPGGSVTGSERIRSAILEARRRRIPVVVSMGNVAASGGYWIATAGDRIFAEPATITGSIGVFGILPTFRGTLEKLGLSVDGVKTTPLSGEPDLLAGTSPAFDAVLQSSIENTYGRFIALVAQSRRLPPARVNEIGQGRVWAGGVARQIGLVDRFGSLDAAIAEAARLAKLDPAKVHALYLDQDQSLGSQIVELFARPAEDGAGTDAFARVANVSRARLAGAVGDARMIAAGPVVQIRCLDCPAGPATGLAAADRTLFQAAMEFLAR